MPPARSNKPSILTILIGLLSVIVLGLVVWAVVAEPAPTKNKAPETTRTDPETKPEPAPREGSSDDSPAEKSASVSGQVKSASGNPLAGARVTLLPLAREGESGEPIDVTCDAEGRWSIAALSPGRYAISATAVDHLPGWRPELKASPGADLTGLDLVLEPGGSRLAGSVSDMTGGVIEGARVQLTPVGGLSRLRERESFFALTDAEGHYAAQVPEGRFRVQASHPDYTKAQAVLDLGAGERTHDFSLVPMGVIEGRVVRANDGSPVAEATVAWNREVAVLMPEGGRMVRLDRGGSTTTDAEGRFRIRGLLPGTMLIHARAPKLASAEPTTVPIAIAEHVADVEIVVGEAVDVRGRVVASDDRTVGVAGAEVDLMSPINPGGTTTADSEGRFVIHGVQPGGYDLFASADGWLASQPTRVTLALEQGDEIVVALERGLAIRGRVEPAVSAEVSIELKPEQFEFGGGGGMAMMVSSSATASSDPETGNFELSPVRPGTYTLVAKSSDGRGGRVDVEVGASGAEDVVIQLEARAKLAGMVRDRLGKPVAGASVIARKQAEDNTSVKVVLDGRELTASHAPTSDEGNYELLGLDAGTWSIEVIDAQGDPLAWADRSRRPKTVVLKDGEVREDFDLAVEARDGTITGIVRDAEGEPVADAWVSATFVPAPLKDRPEPDDGQPRAEMHMVMATDSGISGTSDLPPTLTDAEGKFRIEKLRRGPHLLIAESSGQAGGIAKATLEDVTPNANVVLKLAPLGKIAGRVTGDPNEDCIARPCVVRISGPTQRGGKVQDGSFELDRLDPGRYMLDIETKTGGAHAEVEVAAGETADVELAIQRFGRVKGRILDDQGQPVVGVEILIGDSPEEGKVEISQDGSKEPIVTDAEGRFDIPVAPGSRVVLAIDMKKPGPIAMKRFVAESGKDVDLGDLEPMKDGPGSRPPRGEGPPPAEDEAPPPAEGEAPPPTEGQ